MDNKTKDIEPYKGIEPNTIIIPKEVIEEAYKMWVEAVGPEEDRIKDWLGRSAAGIGGPKIFVRRSYII